MNLKGISFVLNAGAALAQTALPPDMQASIYSANCQLILDQCLFAENCKRPVHR